MDTKNGFVGTVGNTPLIKLRAASEATGCDIYGKAEFLNPGGSVKDRAALAIISDAETKGLLRPGGVIVEGTAGNTGIGLALVGNARGYRTVIVMPETQSQEKKDMLRLLGADLRLVPAAPYANPDNYVQLLAAALAEEIAKSEPNGAIWANQFDNVANRQGHYRDDRPGNLGSRPTARSTASPAPSAPAARWPASALALKERNQNVRIALADPMGAALYGYYKNGELKAEGNSITEGIGQGRVTENLEGAPIDDAFQIPDEEALPIVFDLLQHEGLCLGGSLGINVAGAIRLAKQTRARARPSSPSCAISARAISPSCSTPNSCARRICPCRPGWRKTQAWQPKNFSAPIPISRNAAPPSSAPTSAASCSTAPFSTRPAAASRAIPACWSWPMAAPIAIADTLKGDDTDVLHVPAPDQTLPAPGTAVTAKLDWERRYRHMRMHTALHLLCAVVTGDVTGGQIGADKSRLDFNVPGEALDKDHINRELARLIGEDKPVQPRWIDDAELAARPELVRTMSVKPPSGQGKVRLLDIEGVDLQPCGGTHVARTSEIGAIEVAKIENKGRQNRRVNLALRRLTEIHMPYANPDALVSTDWLAAHLNSPDVRIVDGSWYLPAQKRDPKAEYAAGHIPGAVFFDIDEISDDTSPYPAHAALVGEVHLAGAEAGPGRRQPHRRLRRLSDAGRAARVVDVPPFRPQGRGRARWRPEQMESRRPAARRPAADAAAAPFLGAHRHDARCATPNR